MPQRILILGAGVFQVGLIEHAREMGLETHGVSVPGNYPGIPLLDHYHAISTTDIFRIVELSTELEIDAVVTSGTDVAVPSLGAVADEMELPGVSREVAEIISCKDRFRSFQSQRGLPCPSFVHGRAWEEVREWARETGTPLIFKPADSSGSRGIGMMKEFDHEVGRVRFNEALQHSRRGVVCVESLIPGVEVGGDALLYEGEIVLLAITEKHMDGFLVRGHSFPPSITRDQENAVRSVLARTCDELGYRTGPLNFDIMVNLNEATIIELGARLGGNGISNLIEHGFGYDIEREIISLALGQPPKPFDGVLRQACGSVVFGSTNGGTVISLSSLEEIMKREGSVFGMKSTVSPGDTVAPFEHNGNLACFVTFDVQATVGYAEKSIAILNAVELIVDSSPGMASE